MKVVRELGSDRRETGRSLSTVGARGGSSLVREDLEGRPSGVPVVALAARQGS
jgi:hypothetical protein